MYVRQKPAEEIGRVPHVRLSVHPDFLSRSLALTYFMRLSLMKAAYASVGGASCRKSGTVGRKRRAQPNDRFVIDRRRTLPLSSRPKRSVAEGPAFSPPPLKIHPQQQTWRKGNASAMFASRGAK